MKLTLIVLIVILVWLLSFLGITAYLPDWESRGQFGDLFGSVNSLFSGLAFAALIYTIFLQRKELSLQREELRLQREEMAKSREELATQVKIQRAQFHATVSNIRISAKNAEIEALKIQASSVNPGSRTTQATEIKKIAEEINEHASMLSKNILE